MRFRSKISSSSDNYKGDILCVSELLFFFCRKSPSFNKEIYVDFVAAQIKTLSFLAYIIRIYQVFGVNPNVMLTCSHVIFAPTCYSDVGILHVQLLRIRANPDVLNKNRCYEHDRLIFITMLLNNFTRKIALFERFLTVLRFCIAVGIFLLGNFHAAQTRLCNLI